MNSPKPLKLHIHTDCDYFAGCENMVAILSNSQTIRHTFRTTISYRQSDLYDRGFRNRIAAEDGIFAIRLIRPNLLDSFSQAKYFGIKRYLRFFIYLWKFNIALLQNFLTLLRLFRKIKPDILHINNGGFPASLSCRVAAVAGRFAGIRNIVFVVNNMAIDYKSPYRKIDWPLDRFTIRSVNLFITGSRKASEHLSKVLRISSDKVRPIPNAVEIRQLTENRSETRLRYGIPVGAGTVFGMIGLMLPRKGHGLLISAIDVATSTESFRLSNPFFLIEGTREDFESLETAVHEKGIEKYVRFVGREENIFNFLQAIDWLVYPSIVDEDFPNVISEALSMGVPVITSDVAGAEEQITHNINGLIFERGNLLELSERIVDTAINAEVNSGMAFAARTKYRLNYSPEVVVNEYLKMYRKLLDETHEF